MVADKGKGRAVASSVSPVIGSSSSSVNDTINADTQTNSKTKSGSHPGVVFATEEQPLWKGMEVVSKDGCAGGGNVRFVCDYCKGSFVGSYTRMKAHLLKLPKCGIRGYDKIPAVIQREFRKVQERADAIQGKKSTERSLEMALQVQSIDKKRKSIDHTLEKCFQSYGRAELDRLAGKFFYSSCIPFNVARNPYWKKFVIALANSKLVGYLPPSSERLRTTILMDEKNEVEQNLANTMFKWNTTGVSIVSDGWTDIQRRPLINFIAIACDEPVFLKAVDASGEYKDAEYLKGLFVEVIKEVGPDKVVQIITDNAAVCKSAGLSLRNDFPHVFWTPCVAHTLNLTLKDICTPPNVEKDPRGHELFSWIEDMERDARNIRNFIVNHQHALTLFSSFSELKLLKVAETRFASMIVMLKRLLRVREALVRMVAHNDWSFYRAEDETKAQTIKSIIVEDAWWTRLTYFLEFTEPIWCMLREVDKDQPMLHKVYEMWDNMIEQIQSVVFKHEKKCVALDDSEFFNRIHYILVERWDKSNTPLHCMAHSLNPKYYSRRWLLGAPGRVPPSQDQEISKNRISCMERLYPDPYIRKQANLEYSKFNAGRFDSKEMELAREDEDIGPFDWWSIYGSEMPILQKLALRLLSQPVTSSCCERNWSIYSHIHNIKRNKLTSKRAEDLVYVHSNLRLLSRRGKEYSCGSSQYWDVNPKDFDFEGERILHTANMVLIDPIIPSDDVDVSESIEE